MPISFDLEVKKALLDVAQYLAISGRTAPKAKGWDDISIAILTDEEKEQVALKMESLAVEKGKPTFKRDADNTRNSSVVVLFGVKGSKPRELDCSACGFTSCAEFAAAEKTVRLDFSGPNCEFAIMDLGIALGSATKMCSIFGVDSRIMYTIGVAAKKLNLIDADIILGLPLAATGKNIYFDRPKA